MRQLDWSKAILIAFVAAMTWAAVATVLETPAWLDPVVGAIIGVNVILWCRKDG